MKKSYLLFVALLLVGCNSSSNNKHKGTWENIIANDVMSFNGGKVSPFNTVMNLKYFVSEEIEDKDSLIKDIKTIYQETISDLHTKYDRHYSYKVENDEELVTNIKTVNDSLDSGEFISLNSDTYNLLKLGVGITAPTALLPESMELTKLACSNTLTPASAHIQSKTYFKVSASKGVRWS